MVGVFLCGISDLLNILKRVMNSIRRKRMMMNPNTMNQSKVRKRLTIKSYFPPVDESTLWEIRMKLAERIKDAVKLEESI